jgi:outer membrane protein assembly factor BamD
MRCSISRKHGLHWSPGLFNLTGALVMRRALVILLAVCLLPASACSIRKKPTGQDYYQQAQVDFAQKEFNAAIENYQDLIDYYPFSPYAEDAEMKIGMAYYEMKDYAEAVAALDDFQRMHPTSKNLELVSYYIAMSYYDQIGREDQDQSKTKDALKYFQVLEARFPEGSFAELSRERATVCRDVLARHEMIIGSFYYQRANFKAAESRMAELMEKYPETPIAPEALLKLAEALDKEGKKYSAAQAYTALLLHYPNTPFTAQARAALKRLNQPVDTESDPLPMVLAESGYSGQGQDEDHVVVRQRDEGLGGTRTSDAGGVMGASAAQVAKRTAAAYGPDGLPNLNRPAEEPAPKASGSATIKQVRLSAADPPMSVIIDLTAPATYEKHVRNDSGYSTAIVTIKNAKLDAAMPRHMVFDRSIFKDCNITSNSEGTSVAVNTDPVANVSVVPLEGPPRLLVTFTPVSQAMDHANSAP